MSRISLFVTAACVGWTVACNSSDPAADATPDAGMASPLDGSFDSTDGSDGPRDETDASTANPDETQDGGDAQPPEPDLNEGEYTIEAFEVTPPDPGAHPLGKSRLSLIPREETAFLAGSEAGSTWWEDDQAHGHTARDFAQPVTTGATPVWAEGGHLDADGASELVALYHADEPGNELVTLSVSDTGADSEVLGKVDRFAMGHTGIEAGALDAALGDFDGDGLDEVAVISSSETAASWLRIRAYVDGELVHLDEPHAMLGGRVDAKLAAGNFDDDDAEELAVLEIAPGTNSVTLKVLDDAAGGYGELQAFSTESLLPAAGLSESWRSGGFVRAGNVDDDPQDELFLLLTHQAASGPEVMTRVIDDVTGTPTDLPSPSGLNGPLFYNPGETAHPYEARFADMNGNGVDELYVVALSTREEFLDWTLTQWVPPADDGWNDVTTRESLGEDYNGNSHARMAVVDGDELVGEGLFIALKEAGSSAVVDQIRVHAEPYIDADDVSHGYELSDFDTTTTADEFDTGAVPVVAGGDFDNDNLQVRYTGERWLSLADPRPLVVMAAPPIRDGISQNVAFSETVFGTETVEETSATEEIGTRYSTALSFETATLTGMLGSLGGAASLSFEKSLESSFSSSETQTRITTRGLSYGTSHPDDTVVFQGVLYTSYAYEVISASDQDAIGDRLTVDVPTGVKTYKWTVPYYNANIPAGAARIGEETFHHTPGDPGSYTTPQERDELLATYGGWESDQATVGQGGNVNRATVRVASQTTSTSTSTITDTEGWGIAIAGAGYNASRAVTEGHLFEVTFGTAVSYEGVVGDIQRLDEYEDYAYDFGLFIYNFDHPEGPEYQVVDYWTANLSPGYF